ncbi:hypothetical protein J4463_04100 [Candidatus Pacearchaeota archaeon]|nr:hypothetical protein [Candidatus Pacearchaeota archaeon]
MKKETRDKIMKNICYYAFVAIAGAAILFSQYAKDSQKKAKARELHQTYEGVINRYADKDRDGIVSESERNQFEKDITKLLSDSPKEESSSNPQPGLYTLIGSRVIHH